MLWKYPTTLKIQEHSKLYVPSVIPLELWFSLLSAAISYSFIAAVGSTLFLTTDFDVMTRASFLDRVITMQLESKYSRNLDVCQSVIARKSS